LLPFLSHPYYYFVRVIWSLKEKRRKNGQEEIAGRVKAVVRDGYRMKEGRGV